MTGAGPIQALVGPLGGCSMLLLWAVPNQDPWVKNQQPNACQQVVLPGLAPGGCLPVPVHQHLLYEYASIY